MKDHESKTASGKSSDGVGNVAADALVIKHPSPSKELPNLLDGNCRFINRFAGNCTVSVWYTTGGVSNATLNGVGAYWDLRVRAGDCYCWDHGGPCNANCSLTCAPGGTYYVG